MLADISLPPLVVALAGIIPTVALFVGIFAFYRLAAVKASLEAMKATIETITIGNAELRQVNTDLRNEAIDWQKKVAHLEGQMAILTGHLGEQIAAAVVRALPMTMADRSPQARTRKEDTTP